MTGRAICPSGKKRSECMQTIKILVVDDDRRIVKTTCDILKIKGHEAIAAYSG
jgi:DNA-binding NtrC family response regulator